MRPSLAIFDCDGVLVDSERISVAVLCEVLGEAGCDVPEDWAWQQLLGRSMASAGVMIEEAFGFVLTPDHLERIRSRLRDRFRSELRPLPGVAEAVSALGCLTCVASSSQPDRIALSLQLTDLSRLFQDRVFSATMVANGKPAPDLFLLAARSAGVEARQCVVIEDSPAGIAAARAAGMPVIGFLGGSHVAPSGLTERVEKAAPSAIIRHMRDLPAAVAALT